MGTIGKRLDNPMDILGKKSVYIGNWRKPCAVAFILGMQMKEVVKLFQIGVYDYTPNPKSHFKPFDSQLIKCQNS